jgi:hypothetical protein
VATSSSTKKAAKLAQRTGRASVRFQGGTLFPALVAIILVLGMGLIVYARESRPEEVPPTVNDHWHVAYGFYLCNPKNGKMEWKQLAGNLEQSPEYIGVHSHDDGIIHWHPFSSRAVGENAQLKVFLDSYGVKLDNDDLDFPDDQLGGVNYSEEDTKCGNKDGQLRVQSWQNFTDTDKGNTYTAGMGDLRIDQDAMVFSIAFAPVDQDIPMPPWAKQLPTLGAADSGSTGQTRDPSIPTVPGVTAPPVSAATGDTSVTTPTSGSQPASATTAAPEGSTPATPATVAPATTSG